MNQDNTIYIRLSLYEKMNLLLDIGQFMMESGSNSRRIIQYMLYTADYLQISAERIRIHVTYSTIMLNINTDTAPLTMFRKCQHRYIDMTTLLRLTYLQRRALTCRFPFIYFRNALRTITEKRFTPLYAAPFRLIGAAVACAAFCFLFGGDGWAAAFTACAAAIGWSVQHTVLRFQLNPYVSTVLTAFVATVMAYLSALTSYSMTPYLPMIACTLFLIPGMPLINAIDDLLNDFFTAGMARATHTALLILSITFGITAAITLCPLPHFAEIRTLPTALHGVQALAAGVAALGFAVNFNIPKRFAGGIFIVAAVAMELRNILFIDAGWSTAAASFAGACGVSIAYYILARRLHTPSFVIVTPALIPLVPGVLLYQLLFSVIHIHTLPLEELLPAVQNGVTALFILLGIAIGAAAPDALGDRLFPSRYPSAGSSASK